MRQQPREASSPREGTPAPASAAIARWLRGEARAKDVRIARFERLAGGAIQDNWALDVDIAGGPWQGTHAWVLRTDAPTRVATSLTRAQEFGVLRVAHAAGVLAPRPLFFCRDGGVIGREFFVMERLPGIAQAHRLTREPDLVPDPDALVRFLGANLARIHAIRPPRPDLDAIPPPPAHPALDSIAAQRTYLDRMGDTYPALEFGLRWCERHAPSTFDVTLTHRDYRTGNYLVDNGRVTGVLDWEFAGWGDPRQDLGWFTARCWRSAGVDREGGGITSVEPFLDGYHAVSGRPISRRDLDYWQVMAHLRWAVIALQQARRHRAGGERSLELALTGHIVCELEYEVLRLIGRVEGSDPDGDGAAASAANPSPAPASGAGAEDTPPPGDIADAADLLATAREALLSGLLPELPQERRYLARMTANAMAIAAREQRLGAAAAAGEAARLRGA
ncbi:MAG TPA: phosphotransferase, partial [Casimicrobiaceae bacterium]